jgi:peptide/nickel transport system permease protein
MTKKEETSEFRKRMQPTIKELKFTLKKIKESPLSLLGLGLVLAFIFIAILAPVLAPHVHPETGQPLKGDPLEIPGELSVGLPQPPSPQFPFGTTTNNLNLYYGCIWGTIYAFRLGLLVIPSILAIGVILGMIAGYYGGIIDEILMRFTDIILAFPGLILTMALIVALTRTGQWTRIDAAILSIIIVGWPSYTRLIRGEVLRVKTEDYIEAAKASGASDLRIMLKHILPNAIYPVIIVASLDFGSIVLFAAALSFLGLGAPPRYADWGQLINQSVGWSVYGFKYWWTYTFPGLFITLFCLGWNLLGDAFRDILDPLYRRR